MDRPPPSKLSKIEDMLQNKVEADKMMNKDSSEETTKAKAFLSSRFKDTYGNEFYVDKTKFITVLFYTSAEASLITAPRRFGKTLLIDMVELFLQKEVDEYGQESPSKIDEKKKLFLNRAIWKENKKFCEEHFGKHAVLRVDFKELGSCESFDHFLSVFHGFMNEIFCQFAFLEKSQVLSDVEKQEYLEYCKKKVMAETELQNGLETLSFLLAKHFCEKIYVLLDEVDAPLVGLIKKLEVKNDEVKKIIEFIQGALSSFCKSNSSVKKSFLFASHYISGILSPDLNNVVKFHFHFGNCYSAFLGLTIKEIESCIKTDDKEKEVKMATIKNWYNGYTVNSKEFGTYNIYCPWSVMNYFEHGEFNAYWACGSFKSFEKVFNVKEISTIMSILLVKENTHKIMLLEKYTVDQYLTFRLLLETGKIETKTEIDFWFQFMLEKGNFTCVNKEDDIATIAIPNEEIRNTIRKECQLAKIIPVGNAERDILRIRFKDAVAQVFEDPVQVAVEEMAESLVTLLYAVKALNHVELQSEIRTALLDDFGVKLEQAAGLGFLDAVFGNEKMFIVAEIKAYYESAKAALKQIIDRNYFKYFEQKSITAKKYGLFGIHFETSGYEAVVKIRYLIFDHLNNLEDIDLEKAIEVRKSVPIVKEG